MNTAQQQGSQNRIARALERRLGRRYQQFVFWRAMRRFLREVPEKTRFEPDLIAELVHGWGNSWSAQHEYLDAALKHVRETEGPVLECGSGLSTILMAAVAQHRGIHIWSLEHEPKWAERVQSVLNKYRLHSVTLAVAPLRSYGDFDWYSLPSLQTIPGKISLVVCDGPPGSTTRGGRYGLVPVMLEKLRSDCVILLDDGARQDELSIAARWAQTLRGRREVVGKEKPFIRVLAGQTPPPAD